MSAAVLLSCLFTAGNLLEGHAMYSAQNDLRLASFSRCEAKFDLSSITKRRQRSA